MNKNKSKKLLYQLGTVAVLDLATATAISCGVALQPNASDGVDTDALEVIESSTVIEKRKIKASELSPADSINDNWEESNKIDNRQDVDKNGRGGRIQGYIGGHMSTFASQIKFGAISDMGHILNNGELNDILNNKFTKFTAHLHFQFGISKTKDSKINYSNDLDYRNYRNLSNGEIFWVKVTPYSGVTFYDGGKEIVSSTIITGLEAPQDSDQHYFNNFKPIIHGINGQGILDYDPIFDKVDVSIDVYNDSNEIIYKVNDYRKVSNLKNGYRLVLKANQLMTNRKVNVSGFSATVYTLRDDAEQKLWEWANTKSSLEKEFYERSRLKNFSLVSRLNGRDDEDYTFDNFSPSQQNQIFGDGFHFTTIYNSNAIFKYYSDDWKIIDEPQLSGGHGIAQIIIIGNEWGYDLLPNFEDNSWQHFAYTVTFPKGKEDNYNNPTTLLVLYHDLPKHQSFWDKFVKSLADAFTNPDFYDALIRLLYPH